jgi:hypothetical protein
MTLYYWTPEDYAAAATLTTENASGTATMVDTDGVYWAEVTGIPAKCLDDTYYVAGVYTDANGNTYSTGILPYSLGFYCGNQVKANGDTAALAAAIAVYGYYAASYFV